MTFKIDFSMIFLITTNRTPCQILLQGKGNKGAPKTYHHTFTWRFFQKELENGGEGCGRVSGGRKRNKMHKCGDFWLRQLGK